MALNWDTSGVENFEEVCWLIADFDHPTSGISVGDRILNPVTNALIWHALNTGIGTITEANAGEVYARIHLVEKLHGASLWTADGPKEITIEDVLQHIGLYTNASFKDESRASFLKRHAAYLLDQSKRSFEKKQAEVAV